MVKERMHKSTRGCVLLVKQQPTITSKALATDAKQSSAQMI